MAVATVLLLYAQDGTDQVSSSVLPDKIDDATLMAVAVLEG